ncbi:MAG: DUF456 domain-containing protein [Planctomycetota bacterium]
MLLIALAILLTLVNAVGVVLVLLQLPGTWLIVAATAGFAWATWDDGVVGWLTLASLLTLAILGEILETVLAGAASRKAGGTRRGAVLAILLGIPGAIAGSLLIPIPIVGTLLGAALGAALGSLLGDLTARRPLRQATRAARGAAVGKLTGSAAKLAIALLMLALSITALLI